MINNNKAEIIGYIAEKITFSHEIYGEPFYATTVIVKRTSGTDDLVPVIISGRLIDVKELLVGTRVHIIGNFRSFNRWENNKCYLVLSLFSTGIEILDEFKKEMNNISLEGFICKNPLYRETPLGREICDCLIAVNRAYGKSDYIPCIAWGRNAKFLSSQDVGTNIKVEGRIQSREYQKKISDTEFENRVTYEVSISRIDVIGESEEE